MPESTIKLTYRIPEQFFEREFEATKYYSYLDVGKIDDLVDEWVSDINLVDELYGPDGQQLPLWED